MKLGQAARIRFTDGTIVELLEGSSGAVTERTPAGATFELDGGHAKFDVVHRAHARWQVTAGPFQTWVKGTRFDLSWSPATGSFTLTLDAGSVVVRGGAAGTGISLHAGQRLSLKSEARPTPPRHPEQRAPDPGPSPYPGPAQGAAASRPRAHVAETSELPGLWPTTGEHSRSDDPRVTPSPIAPGQFRPSPPRSDEPLALAAGGSRCSTQSPQFGFDVSIAGAHTSSMSALAFSHPVFANDRSWCGSGSLSVDADFDLLGTPNHLHRRPREAGGVWVDLGRAVDFTAKTLTAHIYVDAPPGIRYSAELYVVNGADLGADWVGGGEIADFVPGRWVTIAHTFTKDNRLWDGRVTDVKNSHFMAIDVYSRDGSKEWRGKVFIDDIGWQ
ncbi:MAG TPA: FecR domain-containing protein [Polyangia bacterium]